MDTITIAVESPDAGETLWRAVSGSKRSLGKTAGEALDKLTPLLDEETSGALVVIQPMRPDRFFTAEQREQLEELMALWRTARDAGTQLPPERQAELEALVEAQLEGAALRAEALLDNLKP
jgi:hypothetical protein